MAQPGHGWQPDHYGQNPGSLQNATAVSPDELGYDNSFEYHQFDSTNRQPDDSYQHLYPNFPHHQGFGGQLNAPTGASVGSGYVLGGTDPNQAAFYPHQHGHGNAVSQTPSYGDSGVYNSSAYSAPDYNQYHAAQPDESSHVPGSFVDEPWQQQPSHQPQSHYSQQAMPYDSQPPRSIYQARVSTPTQAHISTPPPVGQRTMSHFALDNTVQGNYPPEFSGMQFREGHSTPQPTHDGPQYPFPNNSAQLANSPYQAPAVPISQSPAAFANQLQQTHHIGSPAPVSAPSPQPGPQQPGPPAAKKARITSSICMASAPAPAVAPVPTPTPTPAPAGVPRAPEKFVTGMMTPEMRQNILQQRSELKIMVGCPNLYISNVPKQFDNVTADATRPKPFATIVPNKNRTPLFPSLPTRLPFEIWRDWSMGTNNDSERIKLEKEWQQVTGKQFEAPRQPKQKGAPASKVKTTGTPRAGPNSPGTSEYSSEDEESETDKRAREITTGKTTPTKPSEMVEIDVAGMLWQDPQKDYEPGFIPNAILAFGNYIKDRWDKLKPLIKTLKESKTRDPKLERDVEAKLDLFFLAIENANTFCSDTLVQNMGGNRKLFIILVNALRHCCTSKDYNGRNPKAVLRLISRFKDAGKDFLSNVLKLDILQHKYKAELDEEGHSCLDRLFSNAKEPEDKAQDGMITNDSKKENTVKKMVMAKDLVSASKKSATTESKKMGTLAPEARKVSNGNVKMVSPAKRPRDDDTESRALKKVALDGQPSTKSSSGSTTTNSTSSGPVIQPRPRSTSSILPGRARTPAKPLVKKADSQGCSSLSTISGLLAEIQQPTKPAKAKEEPNKAPETEQEKQRRLRKETRRSLRVKWKPDHELTEVREFNHDSAEDEGRASNMIQDARDNKSEGQMFKRGVKHGQQGEEDDDDEMDVDSEDGKPKEISLRAWTSPSVIDLAVIAAEQREKSFVTRGGNRTFHTEEQKFMEGYEMRNLIAVYTSYADIPPTAKSPPHKGAIENNMTAPKTQAYSPNASNYQEVLLRWTNIRQSGRQSALQSAIQRMAQKRSSSQSELNKVLASLRNSSQPVANPYSFATNVKQSMMDTRSQRERDADVFRFLQVDAVKNYVDPNPLDPNQPRTQRRQDYGDPKVQLDAHAIEAVAYYFKDKKFPATEPPEHMKAHPDYVKQFLAGLERDVAARAASSAAGNSQHFATQNGQQTAAADSKAAAAWAAYFASLSQNQAQAPVPVQQQQPTPTQAQPGEMSPDVYRALQIYQSQASQASQIPALQPQLPQQPAHPYQVQQPGAPDIQAILAQLPTAAQPTPAAAPTTENNAQAAYWSLWSQSAQHTDHRNQAPTPQSSYQSNPYHHRGRDRDRNGNNRGFGGGADSGMLDYGPSDYDMRDKASRGRKEKDFHGGRGGKDHKGINRALIGTKPCVFWAQGKCAKGDQCTFRHDPNDIQK